MGIRRRRQKNDDESWLIAYADLITNLLIFFVALLSAAELSNAKYQQVAASLSGKSQKSDLKSIQQELNEQIAALDLADKITTSLGDHGLRVSFNSGVVFPSGGDSIPQEWMQRLSQVMQKVRPYNQQYRIAVEGHTDERPIRSERFRNNWELASSRAHSIRRFLENDGFDRDRMHTESYGDTVSVAEESLVGLSEEEALALHRRVVIRIF